MNPYLPFTRPDIDEDTIAAVADVLRSGWLTSGPMMKAFETALSSYFGRPARVVNSATAALELALRLANVGPGDEVITTPLSWVATGNVILHVGARPVFVDVDPLTRNLDLNKLDAAITARTRALMPVDLAGLPVDRDRLYAISERRSLRVIEDAAQAMGANWRGKLIGSRGDLTAISFHPNKNMTTTEGGCLVMNSEDEARVFERYRLQGVTRHADGGMDCDLLGYKYNLTDVAACIGLGQLKRLDDFNARRRQLARDYFECFGATSGLGLPLADFAQSNWHMFQVRLPLAQLRSTRGELIAALHERGIGSGVHYPAMHLFTLYRALGYRPGDFPHAEAIGRDTLTLPLFPEMTRADVERVVGALTAIMQDAAA
jgi:dTDP-4-amino-4,6-dideoxygalactose transaminase